MSSIDDTETDEAFRTRIAENDEPVGCVPFARDECSGKALDEAAKHVELTRFGARKEGIP